MRSILSLSFFVILLFAGFFNLASCTYDKGEIAVTTVCDTTQVTYDANVSEIITNSCISCHASGSSLGDLSDYSNVMVAVNSGEFKERVITNKNMPPSGALPDDQLQLISCWLQNGTLQN